MNFFQKIIGKIKRYSNKFSEQRFLIKLFYNLNIIGYKRNIFPDGSSANASLLYIVLKFLIIKKPKKIIEFGSGQTTYLMNYMISNLDYLKDCKLISVEDNNFYYEIVRASLEINENHNYLFTKLKETNNGNFYDISTINELFNLILIDGPVGGNNRCGVVSYLDNILSKDDFIIIVDDAHRKEEQKLSKLIEYYLAKNNIFFTEYYISAIKDQKIFLSKNNTYLSTI